MAEWLQNLESNDRQRVEESKRLLHDQFSQVKEAWLVNGLYDRYIATNVLSYVEVLITVREPHHEHLFAKLSESIRSNKFEIKYRALILLGYLVQKQPTWLYKITEKPLFKDLIRLLKTETDILLLLNALLVLIILLPCIPTLMAPYLQDVFEVFSRLAAWNCNPGKVLEEQLVHMQVGLYALFQRLYGMYPCNFIFYLRNCYKHRDASIFGHTIKPMLQTVQMHPLLVINSKDMEISMDRWKKMTSHDVVAECESYSIGFKDRCFGQDACIAGSSFRSRSSTTNSNIIESPYQFFKNMPMNVGAPIDNGPSDSAFSPTLMMSQNRHQTPIAAANETIFQPNSNIFSGTPLQSQEGTSPPETAIEATPETTPIKDTRQLSYNRSQLRGEAVRALTNFGGVHLKMSSNNNTPVHSQPSSPLRSVASTTTGTRSQLQQHHHQQQLSQQEPSAFTFTSSSSAFNQPATTSSSQQHKRESFVNQRLHKLLQDRSQAQDDLIMKPIAPTSPLRIIHPHHEPSPAANRIESPITLEDEEVLEIVNNNKSVVGGGKQHALLRQCDSVLHDDVSVSADYDPVDGSTATGGVDDHEDCEHGSSPCTSGGLHMPNPKQFNAFIKRLRHQSLRASDAADAQTVVSDVLLQTNLSSSSNLIVRRTNSCPEMKKPPPPPVAKSKTLDETTEETNVNEPVNGHHHRKEDVDSAMMKVATMKTSETCTQTDNFWPTPYEHLFLTIFPSATTNNAEIYDGPIKPSPAPSPAPFFGGTHDKFTYTSSYDYLDKYIDLACQVNENNLPSSKSTREQLVYQLLLFERTRRENHATRNRSLVTDMTKKKVLEEHNSALTDQVKLQERDIDELKERIEVIQKERVNRLKQAFDVASYWELKYNEVNNTCTILQEEKEDLQKAFSLERAKVQEADNKRQEAEASLFNIEAEIKVAKEQVQAGEMGREHLENLNRELLLAGETILKYRERLLDVNRPRKSDFELNRLCDVYTNEVRTMQLQLEQKILALDALKNRNAEYEQSLVQYEEQSKVQKRLLNEVKEECQCKLNAIESKYKAQLTVNRALEGRIAELQQQAEMLAGGKFGGLHSPDTSSCHEVNATLTDKTAGLSAHSSPLSASLASSSDGSMAFTHASDAKEVRNLQTFVDQKQPPRSNTAAEGELQDLQNPSTSKLTD